MKITKRQKYWLAVITKQGGAFKYYNQAGNPDWCVVNSDKKLSTYMANKLLAANLLIPQKDGMFGESQVYKAAPIQIERSKT